MYIILLKLQVFMLDLSVIYIESYLKWKILDNLKYCISVYTGKEVLMRDEIVSFKKGQKKDTQWGVFLTD